MTQDQYEGEPFMTSPSGIYSHITRAMGVAAAVERMRIVAHIRTVEVPRLQDQGLDCQPLLDLANDIEKDRIMEDLD